MHRAENFGKGIAMNALGHEVAISTQHSDEDDICKERHGQEIQREQKRLAQQRYRENHPDRVKAQKAAYYEKNKEREQEKQKRYRDLTKEERKLYDRKYRVKSKYGLDWDKYKELISSGCEICGSMPEETIMHLDHDHLSGKIRGPLCIQKAVQYLEKQDA
jgi:hypothetical protein